MSSFGESLRRERELRGIDLREVAEATKISVRFLQALENGRIDILPGGIFPRAFVRQYASYLGLDAERTVAEFMYAHAGGDPVPDTPQAAPVKRTRPLPLGLALAALVLLVVGVVAWRQFRSAPAEEQRALAPAVVEINVARGRLRRREARDGRERLLNPADQQTALGLRIGRPLGHLDNLLRALRPGDEARNQAEAVFEMVALRVYEDLDQARMLFVIGQRAAYDPGL